MKKLMCFCFLFFLSKSVVCQLSPNKASDTLKESVRVSAHDKVTKKIIGSDHHYCLKDNHEFFVNFGHPNSFWPFKFEDEIVKKKQKQLDHIKFAKFGYVPLLYKLNRPVYNKKIMIFLEKMYVDSVYDMENIVFNSDLSLNETASKNAIYMYKKYLLEKHPRLSIEITNVRSVFIKTTEDKIKAAAHLKKQLGSENRIKINITTQEEKELNDMVEFRVLKL